MAPLDYIQHYHAVRVRVRGSGNLRLTLLSLDGTETQTLDPVAMTTTTNIAPTKLCNFKQQRAQLMFKTTAINEVFEINQVNVYIKPIATSYPQ